jgi:hypothetical protein
LRKKALKVKSRENNPNFGLIFGICLAAKAPDYE